MSNADAQTSTTTTVDTPVTETPVVKKVNLNKVERKDLTQEKLKSILELKEDGYFYHLNDGKLFLAGDFAGTIRAYDGYYSVLLLGTTYSGKMLAHFYKEGVWPETTRTVDPDKVKPEKVVRAIRVAPTFTPEQVAAAKKALEEKKKKKVEPQPEIKTIENTDVSTNNEPEVGEAPF